MSLARDEMERLLEIFGERKNSEGCIFEEGQFGYRFVSQDWCLTLLLFRDMAADNGFVFEAVSCALADVPISLDLYRRVGIWRATVDLGAPYVTENGEKGAVLCQWLTASTALNADHDSIRFVYEAILGTGSLAKRMRNDLSRFGGSALEQHDRTVDGAADELLAWRQTGWNDEIHAEAIAARRRR